VKGIPNYVFHSERSEESPKNKQQSIPYTHKHNNLHESSKKGSNNYLVKNKNIKKEKDLLSLYYKKEFNEFINF